MISEYFHENGISWHSCARHVLRLSLLVEIKKKKNEPNLTYSPYFAKACNQLARLHLRDIVPKHQN